MCKFILLAMFALFAGTGAARADDAPTNVNSSSAIPGNNTVMTPSGVQTAPTPAVPPNGTTVIVNGDKLVPTGARAPNNNVCDNNSNENCSAPAHTVSGAQSSKPNQ